MNAPPRVTIIVPTYNRARFLPETLGSLLAQGYPDLEILVMDDGSTDGTAEVVAGLSARAEGIRYAWHPNRGEAATVNAGWQRATGEYVAVVSSDDPQGPRWLSTAVAFMESRPEVVVGYPDWVMIDDSSAPVQTVVVPEFDYERMLVECNCMPGPGALIRRRAAIGEANLRDPAYRLASDFECWLRLGLLGAFARIPEPVAQWRRHDEALTALHRGPAMHREYERLIADFFSRPTLPSRVRALRRRAEAGVALVGAHLHAGVDPTGMRRCLWRAWRADPRRFPYRAAMDLLGAGPALRAVGRLRRAFDRPDHGAAA